MMIVIERADIVTFFLRIFFLLLSLRQRHSNAHRQFAYLNRTVDFTRHFNLLLFFISD